MLYFPVVFSTSHALHPAVASGGERHQRHKRKHPGASMSDVVPPGVTAFKACWYLLLWLVEGNPLLSLSRPREVHAHALTGW